MTSEEVLPDPDNVTDLAEFCAKLGDLPTAEDYQRQALELSRTLGARRIEAFTLGNLGEILVERGDYVSARACLQESLDVFTEIGDSHVEEARERLRKVETR